MRALFLGWKLAARHSEARSVEANPFVGLGPNELRRFARIHGSVDELRAASLQPRLLQQARPIDRLDPRPGAAAVADDLHRNLDAGRSASPDLAVEAGQILDTGIAHRRDDVAAAQAGGGRGTVFGDVGDDDPAVAFAGIDAEPGPRRLVDATVL